MVKTYKKINKTKKSKTINKLNGGSNKNIKSIEIKTIEDLDKILQDLDEKYSIEKQNLGKKSDNQRKNTKIKQSNYYVPSNFNVEEAENQLREYNKNNNIKDYKIKQSKYYVPPHFNEEELEKELQDYNKNNNNIKDYKIQKLDNKLINDKVKAMIVLFNIKWKEYFIFKKLFNIIFTDYNNKFLINNKEIDVKLISDITVFFNNNNTFTYKFLNLLIYIMNNCNIVYDDKICNQYKNLCNEYKQFIYKYAVLNEYINPMSNVKNITNNNEYKLKLKYNTFMDNYNILSKILNRKPIEYYDKKTDTVETINVLDINDALRLVITKIMNKDFLENLLKILIIKINEYNKYSMERIKQILDNEDEYINNFEKELKTKSRTEINKLIKKDFEELEIKIQQKDFEFEIIKKIRTIIKYFNEMNNGGSNTPNKISPPKVHRRAISI